MKASKLFLFLCLGVTMALNVSSCSDYTEWSESEIKLDVATKEYNANFVKEFGEMDPNHSWGFGEMPNAITFGNVRATRADDDYSGVGNVHVKRNEWANPNPGVAERLDDKVDIPGWPNFNGKYYAMEGNYGSRIVEPGNINVSSDFPAGDVTDYEVWYVSKWFRENGNIKSNIKLHLSDFFIQNISCDYDRESYPIATGNDAEPFAAPLGTPITQFNATTHPTHHITGEGNDASSLNYGMDHLVFKTLESNNTIDDTWTHMNNYNNGNTNHMYLYDGGQIKQQYDQREIKYVTSSGTEDFAYQSSLATGEESSDVYYDNWVLVKLEWDEPYGGETYHRVGYYLAFDYETKKGDIRISPDGHYSNWIVKITPGNYIPQEENIGWPRRIMCEDLGNTFDFDFNDVVFDLLFERTSGSSDTDPEAKFDAIITLQAAGGTMDIRVGNNASQYEVHSLFNASVKTPVNVGGLSHIPAIYRVKNCTSKSDDQIDIWVNGIAMPRVHRAGLENYNDGVQQKPGNAAPQKLCVPNTVRWTRELKHIKNPYPHFKDWVNDEHGAYRDFKNDPKKTTETYSLPWYANENVDDASYLMSGTGFVGANMPDNGPEEDPNAPVTPVFTFKIGDRTIEDGGSYSVAVGTTISDLAFDITKGDTNEMEVTSSNTGVARVDGNDGNTAYLHNIVATSVGTTTITITHKACDNSASGGTSWTALSKTFTLNVTDGSTPAGDIKEIDLTTQNPSRNRTSYNADQDYCYTFSLQGIDWTGVKSAKIHVELNEAVTFSIQQNESWDGMAWNVQSTDYTSDNLFDTLKGLTSFTVNATNSELSFKKVSIIVTK